MCLKSSTLASLLSYFIGLKVISSEPVAMFGFPFSGDIS